MIETFIITLIIAKIKKYELKNIFKDWSMYLIFIQLLAYIYLTYTIFVNNFTFIKYQRQIQIIFIVSYFIVAIKNKLYNFSVFDNVNNKFIKYITSPYIISTIFLLIGSGLNNIAIKINNGFMPVYLYTSKLTSFGLNAVLKSMTIPNDYHVLWDNTIHRAFIITDIIDLYYTVLSIGDVFIALFVGIIIYFTVKQNHYNK